MPTRRLLLDSVAAALFALALGVIGWLASEPLLTAVARALGAAELAMTSPYELVWYQARLALAFAVPPLAAWVAAMIERVVAKAVPSWASAALYLLAPAGGVLLAIATRLRDAATLGEAGAAALGGVTPMVTIGSLGLGARAITWGVTFSVLTWIVAAVLAARRARQRV